MKKSTVIVILAIIVLVVLGVVFYKKSPSTTNDGGTNASSTTPSVPSAESIKSSDGLTEYKNSELGFSVKYPTPWETVKTDTGASFIIPIDKDQVSTVAKLQADITVASGKCAFPPVTTIKDRSTLKVKDLTFNTITMANTVQNRSYFNRMYTLQKDSICYFFVFSSITLTPQSKDLKGSTVAQAENNNKALVNSADTAFTNMVKSFNFVVGPAGVDETKAPK